MGILDLFGIGDNSGNGNSGNATGNYLGNLIDPNTAQQFAQAQKDQALLGLSAGLLAGSGPSRLPVPFSAALGQGLLGMMQAQNALPQQALQSAQTSNAVTESQLKKAQTAAAIQQQQFARIYGSKLIDVLNGGGQTANPSGASSTGNNAGPVNLAAQTLAPSTADALNLIAGPESGGNYFIGTGQKPGSQDLLNAPLDSSGFPTWEGHGNSHAAGRYQIQPGTWQGVVDKHFGGYLDWRKPENQDMVAAKLYEDEGFSPWAQYNPKLAAMIQNRQALGVGGAPPSIGGMTAPIAQGGGGAAPTGQTGIAGLPPINGGYPMGLPMSPAQAQALTALAPLGGMKPADFMNGIAGLPVDLLKQSQDAFVKKQAEATFARQIAGETEAGKYPYGTTTTQWRDPQGNWHKGPIPNTMFGAMAGQSFPGLSPQGNAAAPALPSVGGSGMASGLLAPPTGGLLAPGGPVVGAPAPAPMPGNATGGLLAPGGPVVGAPAPVPGSNMVPGGAMPIRAVTGTGPMPQGPAAMSPPQAAAAPGFDPNVWAAQHAKSFPQGIGLVGGHLMPIDEQGNAIPNAPGWRGFTGAPQAAQAGPMAPPAIQVPPAAPLAQSAPNAPNAGYQIGEPVGPTAYSYRTPIGPGQDKPQVIAPTDVHPFRTVMPPLSEQSTTYADSPAHFTEIYAKPWNEQATKAVSALPEMQRSQQLLTTMGNIFKRYESGSYAEHLSEMVSDLKAAGIDLTGYNINKPEDMFSLLKDNFQSALATMKATGIGRFTQMELKMAGQNFAGPNLPPATNFNILSQNLGQVMQAQAFTQDLMLARRNAQGPVNVDDFANSWYARNDIKHFTDLAKAQIGPLKGMTPEQITRELPRVDSPQQLEQSGLTKGMYFVGSDRQLHQVGA